MKWPSCVRIEFCRPRKALVAVAALLFILLGTTGCQTLRPDSCSTARAFRQFDLASPPTAEEREAAQFLPADVQAAVNMYVVKRYWSGSATDLAESSRRVADAAGSHVAPIVAVRETRRYLLLHVRNTSALDHDFFLVYSKTRKCVVGQFAWYVQGG